MYVGSKYIGSVQRNRKSSMYTVRVANVFYIHTSYNLCIVNFDLYILDNNNIGVF